MSRNESHEAGGDRVWIRHLHVGGLEGGPADVGMKVEQSLVEPGLVRCFQLGLPVRFARGQAKAGHGE